MVPKWRMFLFLLISGSTLAAEPQAGWRGNRTGLWPEARTVLEWSHIPRGALDGARCRALAEKSADGTPIEKGQLTDWLVAGPFADDAAETLAALPLGDESALVPPGEGRGVWRPVTAPADDPTLFGAADLPWFDLGRTFWPDRKEATPRGQLGYAHTWIHSPRGGPVRIVLDHGEGLALWLNGRAAYRSPKQRYGLGLYVALSRIELQHSVPESAHFAAELRPGWNRLLVKVASSPASDAGRMRLCLRIMDPPSVPYETKNVRWRAELPGRSTSTPLLVGDRLFVLAEPDELLCFDKHTGARLWTAAVNLYEALAPADKAARPEFAERIDPLVAALARESDRDRRTVLRGTIAQSLAELDARRFAPVRDGHFESHFGIVGFTMPTPVSDGECVYAWNGMGVAACFELTGRRRWITRVETEQIVYGSSPALADGVLGVFFGQLLGIEASTGRVLWQQPRIRKNVAAILAARLAGEDVFVTQAGELVRPRDGHLLFRPRGLTTGDQGWAPPVILGERLYVPRYGVAEVNVWDCTGCRGDAWMPEHVSTLSMPSDIHRDQHGKWVDRWTAGSPVVWDGLLYQVDIYGVLYVSDVAEKKLVYRQPLPLRGLHHYNAVPVAASPTLLGGHLFACDNQGTTVVFAPGRTYREVARNRLDTVLERRLPLPAQETLTYAPPITDGERIFLRGERHLYCLARD